MHMSETNKLRDRLAQYERMESTLRQAIMMAQKTSDQIKSNAYRESEVIIDNAKKNASRIVNEALIEAANLNRKKQLIEEKMKILKSQLKIDLEKQMKRVEEIDKIDIDEED